MNIIIEGMDASGKTTLARAIAQRMFRVIQYSEGPPKSIDEINQRAARYISKDGMIFDRHPCVSNNFYDEYRDTRMPIREELIKHFYAMPNLFIYCDPRGGYSHELKLHDTPEHIALIERNYNDLLQKYRMWSTQRANIVYRIGDDIGQVVSMVRACLT